MKNISLKSIPFIFLFALTVQSCKLSKPSTEEIEVVNLDTLTVKPHGKPIYRASNTRLMDLIHTKLEVSFDWDSTFLYGKAYLTLRPYFYKTDSIILDAKGFQVIEVALIDSIGRKSELNFSYDSLKLRIGLDSSYTRNDEISIFIDYISMPNKLDEGGSDAITSDKGLYFINPNYEQNNYMPHRHRRRLLRCPIPPPIACRRCAATWRCWPSSSPSGR